MANQRNVSETDRESTLAVGRRLFLLATPVSYLILDRRDVVP
jgi:hypothetical protein